MKTQSGKFVKIMITGITHVHEATIGGQSFTWEYTDN